MSVTSEYHEAIKAIRHCRPRSHQRVKLEARASELLTKILQGSQTGRVPMSTEVLEDPINTVEFEVEHTVNNLVGTVSDIAGWRLNNARRKVLMSSPCMVRLLLALDGLQVTVDDLEGKRHG